MRLVFSLAPHAGVRPASTARAPAHTATRAARRAHRDRASDANASLPVEPDARERARARARATGAKDAAGRDGHVGDDDDASNGDARREARRARARNGRRWSHDEDARARGVVAR